MIDKISNFMHGWSWLARILETTLIDNLAASIPWLAPIVPAYMVFINMTTIMRFPAPIALIGATVSEFLGLSTITTAFQFVDYNDARRVKDQGAPVWVAVATVGFYMAVIILVNVILDDSTILVRIAKALFSTLSIAAGVLLSIRSQHSRRLAAIDIERAERKAEHLATKAGVPATKTAVKHSDWRLLSTSDRERIRNISDDQIMAEFGIAPRTVSLWRSKLKS